MRKKTRPLLTTLTVWLRVHGRGVLLARLLGVSESMVSMWASGKRIPTAERCLEIERATIGAVQADTLRPDLNWTRVKSY